MKRGHTCNEKATHKGIVETESYGHFCFQSEQMSSLGYLICLIDLSQILGTGMTTRKMWYDFQ